MAKKNIPYDQKYYDPEIETMPRPELEALQLERLKAMVKYAYENTVWYKRSFDEAGVKPEDIDGSGLQGLKAQQVIHAAIESLNTGRVVYLDEMFPKK